MESNNALAETVVGEPALEVTKEPLQLLAERLAELKQQIESYKARRIEITLISRIASMVERYANAIPLLTMDDNNLNLYLIIAQLVGIYAVNEAICRDVSILRNYPFGSATVSLFEKVLYAKFEFGPTCEDIIRSTISLGETKSVIPQTHFRELFIQIEGLFSPYSHARTSVIGAYDFYDDLNNSRLFAVRVKEQGRLSDLSVDLSDQNNYLYPLKDGEHKLQIRDLQRAWDTFDGDLFDGETSLDNLLNLLVIFARTLKQIAPVVDVENRFVSGLFAQIVKQPPLYVELKKRLAPFEFPSNLIDSRAHTLHGPVPPMVRVIGGTQLRH